MREALRSRVFHVLLGLTLLATVLLPLTVSGDGTATAAVQAILTYSLQAVAVLLSMAAVWLGCAGLSHEIESHRIHMILTKPVHPWMVWLGKWLAVFLMNGVILLVAAAVIYGLIQHRLASAEFSPEELAQARAEVLTGRRVYEPLRPPLGDLVDAEYRRLRDQDMLDPSHDPRAVRGELLRVMRARTTEVQPYMVRGWRFEGVSVDRQAEAPMFFRYRLYVARASQTEQRETLGVWRFVNPDAPEGRQERYLPMQMRGGMFQELPLPTWLVANDNSLTVEYLNDDPQEDVVIFQTADGPTLLVSAAGFSVNYARGVGVIFLRLGFFAALGCAFGAMFSSPVALFLAFAYMLFSIVVDATLGTPGSSEQLDSWIPHGHSFFTYSLVLILDKIVISLREFDIPELLSSGRLVSNGRLASVLFFQLLLRGGPLAGLAVLVFSRREMGKVVRQP